MDAKKLSVIGSGSERLLSSASEADISYLKHKRSSRQMLWFSVAISHKININQKNKQNTLFVIWPLYVFDSSAKGKAPITKNST